MSHEIEVTSEQELAWAEGALLEREEVMIANGFASRGLLGALVGGTLAAMRERGFVKKIKNNPRIILAVWFQEAAAKKSK